MSNRREFLKVIGVTGAGASVLGGCSHNAEKLIPYVIPNEDIVPGVSTWYRTTCRECPAGCGMSVRTREGRAVKVEGNPFSPISHGRLCARGQASLQGLYDPDRIPQPLVRKGDGWDKVTWQDAEARLLAGLQQHRGRTVFLTHNFTGTLDRLLDDWSAAFQIERLRYDTFGWEPVRTAHQMLFGVNAVPVHDFSNADVVVTFGADFLETWVSPVDYAHGWVQSHAYNQGRRGKLIAVSPRQSLTDMNADEWLNVKPGSEHLVALAMAKVIVSERGGQAGVGAAVLQNFDVAQAAQLAGVSPERIREAAFDFARSGRSLAVGPGIGAQHRAATAVAAAVAILNSVAGNIGRTVHLDRQELHTAGLARYADLQNLVNRMRNGQVTALLLYGPNPAFTMVDQAEVNDALGKLPFLASFSTLLDETSERAHLLLPDHHSLESWGDYVPRTGVRSVIQPVMTPVFDTKQTADVLLSVAQAANVAIPNAPVATPAPNAPAGAPAPAPSFYDYLRAAWAREVLPAAAAAPAPAADAWREALKVGVVMNPTGAAAAPPQTPVAAGLGTLRFDTPATFSGEGEFHLLVYPSYRFWDGRHANKMWMQELPDPVSKFTWVSWVEVNPTVADRLEVDTGHIVKVRTSRGEVELPVWVHPGIREDVIAIQFGQGHTALGRYARERGVNPLKMLQPEVEPASGALVWFQTKAGLEPTGRWVRPPQHSIKDDQENREIARTISLNEARDADIQRGLLTGLATQPHVTAQQAEAGGHEAEVHPQDAFVNQLQAAGGLLPSRVNATPQGFPHVGMFWGEYTESSPRWGMAIDMERCTGCSACVTACYAENNIAVVGPDQVAMGRIMHWIRIERYFESNDAGRAAEDDVPADDVPALQQRAVRAGLPGVRRVPYAGWSQRAGLQPLRRHALLREQLPVQGARLQLVHHGVAGAAQLAAEPGCHRPRKGRDGEVHVLRAAYPRSAEPCARGRSRGDGR